MGIACVHILPRWLYTQAHHTVHHRHMKCVEILLRAGIRTDTRDKGGNTAAMLAAISGQAAAADAIDKVANARKEEAGEGGEGGEEEVATASKGGNGNSIPATGIDRADSSREGGAIDQDNDASINDGTEGDASEDAGAEDAGDSLVGAT